jgi:RNase P/RNase MRP subunit p30
MENRTIIQEDDFQKARKKIRENKGKVVVFASSDDDLNRKILEKEDIDILLIKQASRRDRMKQRDSGFNQVLAKIAKKKNIAIAIDLDELISSKSKEKSEILARIRQNIKICNKNKLKMKFLYDKNKRNEYDLRSLGLVLGMPTSMTKNL